MDRIPVILETEYADGVLERARTWWFEPPELAGKEAEQDLGRRIRAALASGAVRVDVLEPA